MSDDEDENITIQNIVATTTIAKTLDLVEISSILPNSEYDIGRFPGLIYHMDNPKTATLLFSSGKVVCTGAKNIKDAQISIEHIAKELHKNKIKVDTKPKITVQNIVATHDIGTPLNLNSISVSLGLENVEYEPEQFPGLVYRVFNPKVVALLFGSGKVVCTGAKNPDDIKIAIKKIKKELQLSGFLP
jgi:transcription initiation factor TFIID TATA-box-binding protein